MSAAIRAGAAATVAVTASLVIVARADEKDVVTLSFARGKVRRVNVVRIITGQECLSVE